METSKYTDSTFDLDVLEVTSCCRVFVGSVIIYFLLMFYPKHLTLATAGDGIRV